MSLKNENATVRTHYCASDHEAPGMENADGMDRIVKLRWGGLSR